MDTVRKIIREEIEEIFSGNESALQEIVFPTKILDGDRTPEEYRRYIKKIQGQVMVYDEQIIALYEEIANLQDFLQTLKSIAENTSVDATVRVNRVQQEIQQRVNFI